MNFIILITLFPLLFQLQSQSIIDWKKEEALKRESENKIGSYLNYYNQKLLILNEKIDSCEINFFDSTLLIAPKYTYLKIYKDTTFSSSKYDEFDRDIKIKILSKLKATDNDIFQSLSNLKFAYYYKVQYINGIGYLLLSDLYKKENNIPYKFTLLFDSIIQLLIQKENLENDLKNRIKEENEKFEEKQKDMRNFYVQNWGFYIREKPSVNSKIIEILLFNDLVVVKEENENWLYIEFWNSYSGRKFFGWIPKKGISKEPFVAENEYDFYAELEHRRKKYINDHPRIPIKIKNAILKGEITIGMTDEQVLVSWGRPYEKNRNVSQQGIFEQWKFGSISRRSLCYLYFQNGKLVSWQD